MEHSKRLNAAAKLDILEKVEMATAIYSGKDIFIEFANSAMLTAWGKGPQVIGMALSDAIPELEGQPFIAMLKTVWETGVDDVGEAIPAKLMYQGRLKLFYFDYAYRAVKDDQGKVYALLHTATDVTDKVNGLIELERAKEREHMIQNQLMVNEKLSATNAQLLAANEELESLKMRLEGMNRELQGHIQSRTLALSTSESRLRYLLADAPIAIAVLSGRELVVESANKKVLEAWGKTVDVIGKPLRLALPELPGQDYLSILDDVYVTGRPYYGYEAKALMEHNGKVEEVYSNFVYQPLTGSDGKVNGIMLTAQMVTEQVTSRLRVQQLNEKLNAINQELHESQERLTDKHEELMQSENRLGRILSELPVPVVALLGKEHRIATTNSALLRLWDRTAEEVVGRTMLEVFPELQGQQYPRLWKEVLQSGTPFMQREARVVYKDRKGGDRSFYIDYFCQPLEDAKGRRIGVISTVFDVTDKVRSRKKIEETESRLRLAIDSAALGTWFIDVDSREFRMSAKLREIFGLPTDRRLELADATDRILESHRIDVVDRIERAINTGEHFSMEYPIRGSSIGQVRWVHATGKTYGGLGERRNFSGVVQDITQRKTEEQRKDDFLSIASHELKTPVTTLKGSLQILERKRNDLAHPIVPKLIDQAIVSVEKITDLIDDLLNTTRTNAGQLHLNYSEFRICDMLEQSCQHIRLGGKHDLVLTGDLELRIWADHARIDQVVVNLVNNAAKYAPEQRTIYLEVEKLNQNVKLSVRDTGPGIPQDKLDKIFDRYYRVDHGGAQYSGLGLGLYISAEIIKRHGGEIGVKSELGKGSTFWFTLPFLRKVD